MEILPKGKIIRVCLSHKVTVYNIWDMCFNGAFCHLWSLTVPGHHSSLLSDEEQREHSAKPLLLSIIEESQSQGFRMTTGWVNIVIIWFLFIPKSTAIRHHIFTLDLNPCLIPFLPCLPLYQCQGDCKPRGKISCSCVCISSQHNSWRTLNWTGNRGSRAFGEK